MEFTIRKLNAKDIFRITNIITKCGISEFKRAFIITPAIAKQGVRTVGSAVIAELASIIISNASKCEKELFSFLSSVSGLEENTVAELSLADFARLVGLVFTSKDFDDFFTAVKGFFVSESKKS